MSCGWQRPSSGLGARRGRWRCRRGRCRRIGRFRRCGRFASARRCRAGGWSGSRLVVLSRWVVVEVVRLTGGQEGVVAVCVVVPFGRAALTVRLPAYGTGGHVCLVACGLVGHAPAGSWRSLRGAGRFGLGGRQGCQLERVEHRLPVDGRDADDVDVRGASTAGDTQPGLCPVFGPVPCAGDRSRWMGPNPPSVTHRPNMAVDPGGRVSSSENDN